MAIYKHTWTTWDALEAITGPMPEMGGSSRDAERNFSGVSLDGAIRLIRDGWLEIVDTIDVDPNLSIGEIDRPTLLWDVTGSEIDIGAYLEGIPECMGEMVNLPQPKPLIRIGMDASYSAAIEPAEILAVGRSILTVVESLRRRGYPTEIYSCNSVTWSGHSHIYDGRILVQAANTPVDVARIAFWTAHPAALRRGHFALEETLPTDERNLFSFMGGGGYGRANHNFARGDFDEWAPSPQHGPEKAAQWISDVLSRRP